MKTQPHPWGTTTEWLEKVWRRRVADRQKAGNTTQGNADNNPMTAAERICRDDAKQALAAALAESADASALVKTATLSAANFARDIGAELDPHHPPFSAPITPPSEWAATLFDSLENIRRAKVKIRASGGVVE